MSFYRNIVWYCKGLKEYTKSGYLSASKAFRAEDLDVDCQGKTFLITGANSGIGKQAAVEIARRGGTIHMVCRNPTSAQEAKDQIVQETQNSDVHVHILDISQPKKILEFSREFAAKFDQLNCLVNNAGCMVNTREVGFVGFFFVKIKVNS